MTKKVKMLCPRCQTEIAYQVMEWGFSGDCEKCWSHTMIQTGRIPKAVMDSWREQIKAS